MARKPLRPCAHAGCPVLTRDGWCGKHRPKKTRRASAAYHGWYSLPIWHRLRDEHLLVEPFCRECSKAGDRVYGQAVDHIRPHRGDWQLFTDPANLQTLCKHHHDQKTAAEQLQASRENMWHGR